MRRSLVGVIAGCIHFDSVLWVPCGVFSIIAGSVKGTPVLVVK